MSQLFNPADLSQFTGTEHYYRHWTRRLLCTDGIQFLVEHGAAWLADAIASYQLDRRVTGNRRLREFQLWEFRKSSRGGGTLTLKEDDGEPNVITQQIEWTDFPMDGITLYVEPGEAGPVLLLPSEH